METRIRLERADRVLALALHVALCGMAVVLCARATVAGSALAHSLTFCIGGPQDGVHTGALVAGTATAVVLGSLSSSSAFAPRAAAIVSGISLGVVVLVLAIAVLVVLLTLDLATDTTSGPVAPGCRHVGLLALADAGTGALPGLLTTVAVGWSCWRAIGRLAAQLRTTRWRLLSPVDPPARAPGAGARK